MPHRHQLIKRAALAISLAFVAQTAVANDEIVVVLDQAKVLQLPAGTTTVSSAIPSSPTSPC